MWMLRFVLWLEFFAAGRLLRGILMVRPPKSIQSGGDSSTWEHWGRPSLIVSFSNCLDESSSTGARGRPHPEFLSDAFEKIANRDTQAEKARIWRGHPATTNENAASASSTCLGVN
jgi:hypothetical protein